MTQKEKIEQIQKEILQIKKKIEVNSNAVKGMQYGRKALVKEWKVYEDTYREYLKKRDRFKNFLWWLYCKVTFRNTKLTEKELTKRTAKKMASIFHKA